MGDSSEFTTFLKELNQPAINVPRAALTLARLLAFPQLDISFYLAHLDQLAEAARPHVEAAGKSGAALDTRVEALADFLFRQRDFHGDRDNYYDPRNSYLNCVLERRAGIPITLATVFVAVAQRLGMRAYGIGLPGHFIAGVYEDGQEALVDTYNQGRRLTYADCARLVRESTGYTGAFQKKWLSPVTPENLLSRMLTNLCHAYIQSQDWRSAIPVVQHLRLIQPEADFHLRDLGYLYLYDGSLRLSARYLDEYLRRSPGATDYEKVRSSLELITWRMALWN